MRIFLDSNVLVSAVATRGLSYDVLRLVLARHELVIGEAVLTEVERVLREKLGVAPEIVGEFDELLRREALIVVAQAPSLGIALRDPSDVPVLDQAVAGEAAVLVTGDRDLLDAADVAPLRILTPRELWEVLRES